MMEKMNEVILREDSVVWLQISKKCMGIIRKANKNKMSLETFIDEATGEEIEVNKNYLKLHKVTLESPAYDAIKSHQDKTIGIIKTMTRPVFGHRGVFWVPLDYVEKISNILDDRKEQTKILMTDLKTTFLESKEAMKERLGPDQFREADYPSVDSLDEKFGIIARWTKMSIPETLPAKIASRAIQQNIEEKAAMAQDIRVGLRKAWAGLIEQATNQFVGKRVYASLLENLNTAIEVFNGLNLTNDKELEEQVRIIKLLVNEVGTAESIRGNGDFQELIGSQFEIISKELVTLVENAPRRKFAL